MRRAAAWGRPRGRLTAPCRLTRSAPWSGRAKGDAPARPPQCAKRARPQGRDQAAVQCKRMGDPSHVGEGAPAQPIGAGS